MKKGTQLVWSATSGVALILAPLNCDLGVERERWLSRHRFDSR